MTKEKPLDEILEGEDVPKKIIEKIPSPERERETTYNKPKKDIKMFAYGALATAVFALSAWGIYKASNPALPTEQSVTQPKITETIDIPKETLDSMVEETDETIYETEPTQGLEETIAPTSTPKPESSQAPVYNPTNTPPSNPTTAPTSVPPTSTSIPESEVYNFWITPSDMTFTGSCPHSFDFTNKVYMRGGVNIKVRESTSEGDSIIWNRYLDCGEGVICTKDLPNGWRPPAESGDHWFRLELLEPKYISSTVDIHLNCTNPAPTPSPTLTNTPVPPTDTPTPTGSPKPNLIVSSLSTNYLCGSDLTYTAIFANIGEASVNLKGVRYMIRLTYDDNWDSSRPGTCFETEIWENITLNPGQTYTSPFHECDSFVREYIEVNRYLSAVIDSTGVGIISESNEYDNIRFKRYR